jgi:SSS family transporter
LNIILIGILAYISLQLFIGFYISRFIKSEDDYLLGGRRLGFFLTTFSIFATWFGAESCIGTAGASYESGLSGVTADPFGYGFVLLLMGFFFSIPLYKRNLTTIADFFRERFSPSTERLVALIMIPTSILWAAAQIRAFGLILSASSGLDIQLSIFISAIIVITYTVFGGLLADAWTDLVQGFILIIGLIILFIMIFFDGVNVPIVLQNIASDKLKIISSSQGFFSLEILSTAEAWAIPICGSLIAQELVSRVLAAKSQKVARTSAIASGFMYIIIGLIPLTIGLIGNQLISDIQHSEQILPLVAQKYLSSVFYVIFTGALISAILSTVDSTLLASSALMSHNLIFNYIKPNDEKIKLKITRLNVFISGVIAYLLATYAEGVYELVKDASAFGSSGIFVIFIFGLLSRRGNGISASLSLITGAISWITSHYILDIEFAYLISLLIAFTTFVMSLLTEKYHQELKILFRKIYP